MTLAVASPSCHIEDARSAPLLHPKIVGKGKREERERTDQVMADGTRGVSRQPNLACDPKVSDRNVNFTDTSCLANGRTRSTRIFLDCDNRLTRYDFPVRGDS